MNSNSPPRPGALVVEDDDNIAYLLQFMLERENFRVDLQREGRSAMAYVQTQPPVDIVLLDVMLPFVDGFQLVELIRATPAWRDVPVLMLTAKTREQDAVRALDSGASDYIHKPFAPNELMARVRRHTKATK
ncbi:response regulator transcription factor [Variovorax soli]|uniref:response regulator transcription factor n=1 Tax=Variovorax soli TaxID=376815 RepID=UPI0008396487|nr:response regulator [Variovorax soli]